MIRGELEIVLTDDTYDTNNQSLDMTKQLYSDDDELLNPKDAIDAMVNFLRTLTYCDDTILCALADEITDLTQGAAVVYERNDRYEVCE